MEAKTQVAKVGKLDRIEKEIEEFQMGEAKTGMFENGKEGGINMELALKSQVISMDGVQAMV